MKRLLLGLLMTVTGTANAALPRVVLGTPMASAGSAPAAMAAPAAGQLLALPSAAPVLAPMIAPTSLAAAPALQAAVPAAAAPVPSAQAPALAAPALAALPVPSHDETPRLARDAAAGPKALDALLAHASQTEALAQNLKSTSLENAAPALARNFALAAGMDSDGTGGGTVVPGGPSQPGSHDHLLDRLLKKVTLEEDGHPERREALTLAFRRMLKSPTARGLAERFLASGAAASVRLEAFEGSRVYEANGRKIFYAPRAFTEWQDGRIVVRMNLDYLGTDAAFQEQDLPPTIAHELFGHGLWYSRAAREDAFQAFHHHELNETNARLVGWLVDFELDRRFEENGAWSYLQDPAGFLAHLKLRLPYYALTFSNAELARPVEALEARSTAAKAKRERLRTELANHVSWNPVIDHFSKHHGVAETRLRALRGYMADTEQSYKDDLAVMDALINEVDATIGRMKAEPERTSERYLQAASALPLFADLQNEAAENGRKLHALVSATPAQPTDEHVETTRARDDHWRGQVTFEEMVEMYRKDREKNPGHWNAAR